MKFLVVACLVALAVGKDLRSTSDGSLPVPRVVQMIRQNGYRAAVETVETSDGYQLDLIRIPHGRNEVLRREQQEENQGTSYQGANKQAVLLMHNMLGSAEDWIYGGPSQGLAYQMADENMDVYLGNSRGSKYGMGHTKLDASKDTNFWDFTWDDIATKDMPAIVQKVKEMSNQQTVQIVGHMTGATATILMASEVPQAKENVSRIVALGPISFMKRATQPFMKAVQPNRLNKAWVLKNLGNAALKPSTELQRPIEDLCKNKHTTEKDQLCENLYFLLNGFNSLLMNQTTVTQALRGVPSGASVKQILHMAQLMESGRFQRYQPNESPAAKDYDLSKASQPIIVMYAPEDWLSQDDDVQSLVQRLPNAQSAKIENVTNNMDLLYAQNVSRINQRIIDLLNKRGEDVAESDMDDLSNISL